MLLDSLSIPIQARPIQVRLFRLFRLLGRFWSHVTQKSEIPENSASKKLEEREGSDSHSFFRLFRLLCDMWPKIRTKSRESRTASIRVFRLFRLFRICKTFSVLLCMRCRVARVRIFQGVRRRLFCQTCDKHLSGTGVRLCSGLCHESLKKSLKSLKSRQQPYRRRPTFSEFSGGLWPTKVGKVGKVCSV